MSKAAFSCCHHTLLCHLISLLVCSVPLELRQRRQLQFFIFLKKKIENHSPALCSCPSSALQLPCFLLWCQINDTFPPKAKSIHIVSSKGLVWSFLQQHSCYSGQSRNQCLVTILNCSWFFVHGFILHPAIPRGLQSLPLWDCSHVFLQRLSLKFISKETLLTALTFEDQ